MLHKIFIVVVFGLAIASCSNKFKQKVGLATIGPNEYQVQKFKSLEIPPHYELHPPVIREKAAVETKKKSGWLLGR